MGQKADAPSAQMDLLQTIVDQYHPHLIDKMSDGLMLVQNARIKSANRRIAEFYGEDIDHLLDLPAEKLLPQFDRIDAAIQTQLNKDPQSVSPITLRTELASPSQGPIDITIEARSVRFDNHDALLLLLQPVTQPITIAKEAQASRHLESIAALSGGIAHDFNNLLTVIIGNISLIQSYTEENNIIYKMLNEANQASMMAKALTQKLITFSKGGGPLKETTELAPLVKSTGEFSLSGSNIKAEFDLSPDLFLVEIDRSQISQTIHNIITNAKEAMPHGGKIRVAARNVVLSNDRRQRGETGRYVLLEITDEGVGISELDIDKIFDPFFSTKERGSQKGMGLGLSICHSIIEKHNGWMTVKSPKGAGTSVQVFLPASEKSQVDAQETAARPPAQPLPGQGRILVMDDEEMIIKLAGLILERLGYTAEFARNGQEAVEKYRQALQAGQPFDAVILDLTVRGGQGGQEAIQELLSLDPGVKGIVSSGYSESPVLTHYHDYGFKGVVVKPYSLAELSQALFQVMNG